MWVHGGGVRGCHGGGGKGWGFLLWVICGFMVVKVGGCYGVVRFGYVLRGGGGGSRWLRLFEFFFFIWVLRYIILLRRNIILICCIVK